MLPGRCLALPGFLFWSSFSFVVPKYPRFSNSNCWEKINFHLEVLPWPTPVVVTCLSGPPSEFRELMNSFNIKLSLVHLPIKAMLQLRPLCLNVAADARVEQVWFKETITFNTANCTLAILWLTKFGAFRLRTS